MENILATRNLETLADFACSSVLLAFDYDGTLAPIASRPQQARMRAATRRLLVPIAQRYPCVVISGRRRDDLARRLAGLRIWHVIGNHGFEPLARSGEATSAVREWVRSLRKSLPSDPGLLLEDKKYSVTLHYRHVRDKTRVRRAIAEAVCALPNVRVLGGAQAINLILNDGVDKGVALQRARRDLACDTAIYVGDDDTDEDAFRSAPRHQLLGIRVGRARISHAQYRLRSQADVDHLLLTLLMLRSRVSPMRERRRPVR